MDDPDHNRDELLQMFMAVTGCSDAATALHLLEAHDYDINQATNDYLEHGPGHPVPYTNDPLPVEPNEPPPPLRMPNIVDAHADHGRGDYIDLTGGNDAIPSLDDDDAMQDLHTLAAHRAARVHRQDAAVEEEEDVMPATRPRASRRRPSSSQGMRRGSGMMIDEDDDDYNPEQVHDDDYEFVHPPRHHVDGIPLPVGIDIEEARMLEAAMLGIPYDREIPPHRRPHGAALGLGGREDGMGMGGVVEDPAAVEQRLLRQEQDDAYEESLRADRAKAEAAARQAQEAAAAQAAAQQQAEQAAAQAAAHAAHLQRVLSSKEAGLPEEPNEGEQEGVVTVMVRLPGGDRCSRRFRVEDSVTCVFDYVDVQQKNTQGVPPPGGYRLVAQYPRRVLEDTDLRSLRDAGLDGKNEVLMLEPL